MKQIKSLSLFLAIGFVMFATLGGKSVLSGNTFEPNTLATRAGVTARSGRVNQTIPQISYAWFQGKRLMVKGSGFGSGAVVFLNGVAQKTKLNDDGVSEILIAKKAGKLVSRETVASVWVQNADGQSSDKMMFFTGCN